MYEVKGTIENRYTYDPNNAKLNAAVCTNCKIKLKRVSRKSKNSDEIRLCLLSIAF